MKKRTSADSLLTLTPTHSFSLEHNGFIGHLYQPEQNEYPSKALILLAAVRGCIL